MKISPGMAEAGVNAMAKAKRAPIADEAIVASIYSAMDLIRRQEDAMARGPRSTTPPKYEHTDWPAWRYGPDGEGKVFANPEDVPEGWADSVQVHALERDAKVLSGTLTLKPKKAAA